MWYMYTVEYYSATKKNEIMPFCSNMDGPRDHHTRLNKSDKDRLYHLHAESKKIATNELIYKTETHRLGLTDLEDKCVVASREEQRER